MRTWHSASLRRSVRSELLLACGGDLAGESGTHDGGSTELASRIHIGRDCGKLRCTRNATPRIPLFSRWTSDPECGVDSGSERDVAHARSTACFGACDL